MKKIFKGLLCAGLCGILAFGAAGCSNKSEHRDSEKDALNLAIGSVDQKFNPLFYTSANDGTIANMTQVSMLSADAEGNLAYGENYPTVTLDYCETYKDSGGNVLGTHDGVSYKVPKELSTAATTEYEFLIKNGMMFSDGEHKLTVMDVLFNLYIYLDPVYNGSNTIYSTKIQGLQAYRQQNSNAEEGSSLDMSEYYGEAIDRLNNLLEWSKNSNNPHDEADFETVKKLYKSELESTWNTIQTGWRDAYKETEYRFTEAWEAFYFAVEAIQKQTETNENGAVVELKDEQGRYLTSLDPDKQGNVARQQLIDDTKAAYTDDKVKAYMSANGVNEEDAKLALQRDYVIDYVYNARATRTGLNYILNQTATYGTAMDEFAMDALSKATEGQEMRVQRISGITVSNTKFTDHKFNGKTLSEDHDVLKITVVGVDPKAKWNFGFAVTPMYYYSDAEHYNAAMKDYNDGSVYNNNTANFGVKYRDIKWFNSVPGGDDKTGFPVGAGAYKCSNSSYGNGTSFTNFFKNYTAYFVRNEYFTTMGAGIDNAKIRCINYKVTRDDKIVESLKARTIDYGEPNATSSNQSTLRKEKGLEQITYMAGGYGYVGINPRKVPDMEVRQVIMHAFDTSSIRSYYPADLVSIIDRPMSLTSWAYPHDATRYYSYVNPETEQPYVADELRKMITDKGNWRYENGRLRSNQDNSVLKLTFTIAGESTDHPSYQMFLNAEDLLEDVGMEITVMNSVTALQDLATGNLAVWAAAWSSSIDPDPYQIYSLNSNASSTKNWNKDGIVKEQNGKFAKEYAIAKKLSEKIDEGRATLDRDERTEIYSDCLDLIMQLAVEFPTYQRNNLCVYNSRVIDGNTIYNNEGKGLGKASFNMGPLDQIWKVDFVK